jgi:hypothetical protein
MEQDLIRLLKEIESVSQRLSKDFIEKIASQDMDGGQWNHVMSELCRIHDESKTAFISARSLYRAYPDKETASSLLPIGTRAFYQYEGSKRRVHGVIKGFEVVGDEYRYLIKFDGNYDADSENIKYVKPSNPA